jgi:hypothetical protein
MGVDMTPEEVKMVVQWIDYFRSDEMVGAKWHHHVRSMGGTPPQETLIETGRRLREEVSKVKEVKQ